MSEAAPERVAQAADAFKPHVFGKFFLLQRIALGGMAEIFRAKVIGAGGFEKELVVKRILPAQSEDEGFIRMLVNEAKLTVQLTHNNVAQIQECGAIADKYFLAMELVNGVSMKEMMASFARANQHFSPEQAMFLVLQLLQGLDYAHRKTDVFGNPLKIVHCDVSPDNALVSWEGEVKLTDFGIARAATSLSNYKEGMLMGKLGYVAPEQASLEQTFDHRVDIFAAGIILYELLTGQKPFARATDVESLIEVRRAKVPLPSEVNDKLPKEIDEVIMKALAYDPDDRFGSARLFGDALVDILFPTPQSSIQDLMGRQIQAVYSDKIAKQRAARTHDTLIMKVLVNSIAGLDIVGGNGKIEYNPEPIPVEYLNPARAQAIEATNRRIRTHPRKQGVPTSLAFLLALAVAAIGILAFQTTQPYFRRGILVVHTTPPGAQVKLNETLVQGTTPLVVEGVNLSRANSIEVSADLFRTATFNTEPSTVKLAETVRLELESAIVSLEIDSEPPGAAVRLNEKPVGLTPLTLQRVRGDQRLRIDLVKPGFDIDQFVALPDKDGKRFFRKLVPLTRKNTGQ